MSESQDAPAPTTRPRLAACRTAEPPLAYLRPPRLQARRPLRVLCAVAAPSPPPPQAGLPAPPRRPSRGLAGWRASAGAALQPDAAVPEAPRLLRPRHRPARELREGAPRRGGGAGGRELGACGGVRGAFGSGWRDASVRGSGRRREAPPRCRGGGAEPGSGGGRGGFRGGG